MVIIQFVLGSITYLLILVKGILRADDAELANHHGVAGIIVSNHGGRQLDGVLASVIVLYILNLVL